MGVGRALIFTCQRAPLTECKMANDKCQMHMPRAGGRKKHVPLLYGVVCPHFVKKRLKNRASKKFRDFFEAGICHRRPAGPRRRTAAPDRRGTRLNPKRRSPCERVGASKCTAIASASAPRIRGGSGAGQSRSAEAGAKPSRCEPISRHDARRHVKRTRQARRWLDCAPVPHPPEGRPQDRAQEPGSVAAGD